MSLFYIVFKCLCACVRACLYMCVGKEGREGVTFSLCKVQVQRLLRKVSGWSVL